MKPKYFIKIVFASVLAVTTGCSKVLDTPYYGFYEVSEILKTEDDANRLLNGAYCELSKQNWSLYHSVLWVLIDIDNDQITGPIWLISSNGGAGGIDTFWGHKQVWPALFQIIGRCNTVLEKVSAMSIDETVKNNVLGEAQALRAWAYFMLVQMYGQVPLRSKSIEADPTVNVPRSPISDVYKLIVDDLTAAIPKLLPKGDTRGGGIGRISKPAAMAILAKVYLTMASGNQKGVAISVRGGRGKDNTVKNYTQNGVAGYESFTSNEYFKKSLELSDAIINGKGGGTFDLVKYNLDSSPKTTPFSKINNYGAESLWYLQFKAGTELVNEIAYWYKEINPTLGSGGWAWVSSNFYDWHEDKDYRVSVGIYHQFISEGFNPYVYPKRDSAKYAWTDKKGKQAVFINRALIRKYDDVSNPNTTESDATIYISRFADVLLMFAEAENEVNGPTPAAYDALNRVRRRSNASDAPLGMSKDDFRSFVFEERAKEFVQECNRKFDLLRRGVYLQVMNAIGIDQENNVKSRTEKHLLYPIPQGEIDASAGTIVQNPGW